MGKELDEVKQLHKCGPLDLHRHMLPVEYDTVLIVIYIRRILESPLAVVDRNRNDPVILPCRMVQAARISFILHAQQALGITAGLGVLCRGNGLGILLRLGQVDGDVDLSIGGIHFPFHIFLHAVAPDIVAVLAELIIVVRGLLRGYLIFLRKCLLYLGRPWKQAVHKPRVKEVPVSDTVLDNPSFYCLIQQFLQHGL